MKKQYSRGKLSQLSAVPLSRHNEDDENELILGHRGYHRDVPDNTLAAFDRALAMGVDGIETDVQVSADGVAILFHDRCAPDGTPMSSLTHAELKRRVGYSVPRLEEAVTEWGKEVLWNLELKTASSLEPTIALVNRYQSTKRFLVTSFLHPLVLDLVNRTSAEGGLLVAHRPLNGAVLRDWTAGSMRVTTIVWDYDTCDGDLMARRRPRVSKFRLRCAYRRQSRTFAKVGCGRSRYRLS